MIEVTIPYKPRAILKQVHECQARYVTLIAHRRCGKSIWALNHIQRKALQKKGRYAIVCPLYTQANSVYWLSGLVDKYVPNEVVKKKSANGMIIHYKNGSILQFLGSDASEPHRGSQFDGLVMDEFSDHDYTGWQSVFRYTIIAQTDSSFSGGWVVFMGTLKGENHLWQEHNRKGPNRASFLFRASETGLLSAEDIAEIREECDGDESLLMQELECVPLHYSGLIFKEFGDHNRIEPFDVPFNWGFGYALDHGANNPTAFGVYRIDPEGNVYKVAEYYKAKDIITNHAPYIRSMRQKEDVSIIADPSIFNNNLQSPLKPHAYSVVDEYEDHGIGNFVKANNSVIAGINRMREYLRFDPSRIHPRTGAKGAPKFFVFKDACPMFEKECKNYRWKEKKEAFNDPDEPIKLNDHAMDETRYFLMSRPAVPDVEVRKKPTADDMAMRERISLAKYGLEDRDEDGGLIDTWTMS